jgi:excisionase family DNA binding protein
MSLRESQRRLVGGVVMLAASTGARLLTVKEVADWLRVPPAWVRAHADGKRRPVLPSIKLGRVRRFEREAIEQWLQQLRKSA